MESRKAFAIFALLCSVTLAGCSDGTVGSSSREKVYKVTGKVTMGGAPVANAFVTFAPSGKQPAATGRTDTEGKYTLTTYDPGDGAAAGDYTALVTKEGAAPAAPGGHDPKNTNPAAAGAPTHAAQKSAATSGLLPTKYSAASSSDLKVTVKADGANDIALDLKP
jgi:hypothetical protein